MIPKFTNPHLRASNTHIVSRDDLIVETVEEHEGPVQDEDALSTLEVLIKRSLGEFQAQNGVDSSEGSSERARKRKRTIVKETDEERKLDASNEAVESILRYLPGVLDLKAFRLVSKSRTPFLLSLKPKPAPVLRVLEPSYEDDENEARIRTERAAAIAVDADWVFRESQKSYPAPPGTDKLVGMSTDTIFGGPAMFIAQLPLPPSVNGHAPTRPRLPEKSRPSPHNPNTEKLKYPVVECQPTQVEEKRRVSRRRRKAEQKQKEPRPPPAFWRPMMQWGGKSAGYAFGFTSSRPIWTETTRWRPYRRDNMRKATVVV
ncbi:hypothetical protein EIP91_008125 [Steccherinum ochraceum]|uniref:Uncharacterized protein n=1 Tax=Steccherinum ochraceum TaxID=92696 RepID=A0A4R0R5N3_9APHY|nr:hypothetical protein EIP91_008125 [Steccherinum ochraceum]